MINVIILLNHISLIYVNQEGVGWVWIGISRFFVFWKILEVFFQSLSMLQSVYQRCINGLVQTIRREGNNFYIGSIQDESKSNILLSNLSLEGFH